MTGIDFDKAAPAGGFSQHRRKTCCHALADDEIALNSWAADDLQAKIGDPIRMTYFEPESTHGKVRERTVELRLAAILPLSGAAADANLTPTLPGVTDQLSIADWNPPFPFDSQRVRPRDEEYWDDHKATPKAFVALATAQAMGKPLWRHDVAAHSGGRGAHRRHAGRSPATGSRRFGLRVSAGQAARSKPRPGPLRFNTCFSASACSSSPRR